MASSEWKWDKKWSDFFVPQIAKIINCLAGKIIKFSIALDREDCEEATDYIITVETGTIACRIRRPECQFRDFTVRSTRVSGAKTELAKLREGFARWYLYVWTKTETEIDRYVLVDLNRMRERNLFEMSFQEISNLDGKTFFVAIPLETLIFNDCIVHDSNHPKWQQVSERVD